MDIINLSLDKRGKKDNLRNSRVNGFIPAVIYGKNMKPILVLLNYKEFVKTFAKHSISSFIGIESKETELNGKTAVIKEIQKDPVTEKVIHIDFHEISMNDKIEIEASIHFIGKAEGIKLGGILEPLLRHILVKGYPKDIIDKIDVDVTHLNIGDIIHIKDINLPEGVEFMADLDTPVVMVAEPKVEEVAAATVAATEEQPTAAAAKSKPQQGQSKN